MGPQLLIFLAAIGYLSWTLVRHFRKRAPKGTPFIEVIDDSPSEPQVEQSVDEDSEWRRRVRAEIEEMTK